MLLKHHTFALILALGALPGCAAILPSGPSNVAQGRYYSTGNPEYDDFFLRLYRLQIALKDAPPRLGEPRQKLADALESGPDPDNIKVALAKRSKELQSRGIRYTVARAASPDKPPTLVVTGNPTGNDFELKGLLEGALTSAGELKRDVTAWTKELDELSPRQGSLEGSVNEAFASSSEGERTQVKNNLEDGGKIITLLNERTRDLDHATTDFLKSVTSALGEATVDAKPDLPEEEDDAPSPDKKDRKGAAGKPAKAPASAKAATKGRPPGKSPAPRPAAAPAPKPAAAATPKPAPAPVAKPSPKPAAREGDAPAPPPKPAQGTAKPDFEP